VARFGKAGSPEDVARADDDRDLWTEFADFDDSFGDRFERKTINSELARLTKTFA
jgi:hypothetical protein